MTAPDEEFKKPLNAAYKSRNVSLSSDTAVPISGKSKEGASLTRHHWACRRCTGIFTVATGWPRFYGYGVPSAILPGQRWQRKYRGRSMWAPLNSQPVVHLSSTNKRKAGDYYCTLYFQDVHNNGLEITWDCDSSIWLSCDI